MKKLLNNKFLYIAVILNISALIFFRDNGIKSMFFIKNNLLNFVFILTPVFICVGLLDVWVDRDKMIKIAGKESGFHGVFISFLLGILTAVPLYALLPVAGILLKKRSTIFNVLIFICSSASIRIPLLLFETSSMGFKFTSLRFVLNFFTVLIISFLIEKLLNNDDKEKIYKNAENI